LNLTYDEQLSNVAFNCNLRPCTKDNLFQSAAYLDSREVGRCRLTPG